MSQDNRTVILRAASVALVAVCLGGCIIPYNRAIAPGIDTRLVDAKTGAGVGGAIVTLSVGKDYKAEPRTAVSAPDGSVKIEAIRELMFAMPAQDVFPVGGMMHVEAAGYEPLDAQTWEKVGKRPAAPGPATSLTPKSK